MVKIIDIAVIALAIVITGLSVFAAYIRPQNSRMVMIQGQTDKWVYPLDAEETISVSGPLGRTIIRIHQKEVWVDSSPCDNQTCVGMGRVSSRGAWAACLPNKVLLIIEGSDEQRNSPDSIAW